MRVDSGMREPSDSAALTDGDFVQVILAPGAVFFARVVEGTDVYLRVVVHSIEKHGQLRSLPEHSMDECLAMDAILPWSNIALVMHSAAVPRECACLVA